ncbi:MAG: MotA/TolQ/ExbB proton channel family protein, partial [Hyphomicrobiales bacterium]|nr:MotA/TolQ/ExbB proton channel family protein [Hyphomicrobiales bacterium]
MNAVYSFIELGGPVVALLALVSVVSLAVILLKICQYWRSRVGSRARADQAVRLWKSGQQAEAISHAVAGRSLAAAVVAQAMRFKVLGLDRERIEEHLSRIVAERLHDLQSGFRFLDVVAQTAPLLGLFGTVLGMIEAFRELQSAGSAVDPSVLAGGIWVAL